MKNTYRQNVSEKCSCCLTITPWCVVFSWHFLLSSIRQKQRTRWKRRRNKNCRCFTSCRCISDQVTGYRDFTNEITHMHAHTLTHAPTHTPTHTYGWEANVYLHEYAKAWTFVRLWISKRKEEWRIPAASWQKAQVGGRASAESLKRPARKLGLNKVPRVSCVIAS